MKMMVTTQLAAVIAALLLAVPVNGDTVSVIPAVSVKGEYNDNVLLESDEEEDDFITTISPELIVRKRSEKTSGSLNLGVNAIYYSDLDDLNTVDTDFSGSIRHQVTERFGIGGSAGYLEDSRKDRETEDTGLIVSGDWDRMTFKTNGDYQFTEKTMGSLSLGYAKEDIEDPDEESNDWFRTDLAVSRNLSDWMANTTGEVMFSYIRYRSEVTQITAKELTDTLDNYEADYDVFRLVAGLSREVTELYTWFVKAGVTFINLDETSRSMTSESGTVITDPEIVDKSDTSWGGVVAVGVTYSGLYTNAQIKLFHDIATATGFGGMATRTAVSARISRKLTEAFTASASGAYYWNKNNRNLASDIDSLTARITAGVTYGFPKEFKLSAFWTYLHVENREDDSTSKQNKIYLLLTKTFDIFNG